MIDESEPEREVHLRLPERVVALLEELDNDSMIGWDSLVSEMIENAYDYMLAMRRRREAALQEAADQPAATETGPEVADDPYDGCLVAGCVYVRGHKGKCFQPGDVVPAASAPQGAPRCKACGNEARLRLCIECGSAPQGAPQVYACRRCGDSLGRENESGFCPPCENNRPYEVVK